MADQFQQFDKDKTPIIPDTIVFRTWRFGFREVILGIIALILLFMCLIFAGLFGSSSVQLQEARVSAQTAMARACKDSPCLRTTAHSMELINISTRPCDNFFQFACGGFKVRNPLDPDELHDNIYRQMRDRNQERLLAILDSPTEKDMIWSSERKAKHFFQSCTNQFLKEQIKAKPLLEKVLPMLGGWYVLDTNWNQNSWDLNAALKTVHTELWLDALYSPYPSRDQYNWKNAVIVIRPGGAGRYMRWSFYTDTSDPKLEKIRTDYKTFMRTVARLLARDAKVTDASLSSRIEVFVDDAFNVEANLSQIALSAQYQGDPYHESKKISLGQLTQDTGNVIDWTVQMSYLFNEAGVTSATQVVLPYPGYMTNLTAVINSFHPDFRNRMLHNYLMWRVLETYVQDLSWEYVHANRQLYVDLYGPAEFLGTQRYCFYWSKFYFDTALGALYVQKFFDERNKNKVTEITEAVKQALEDMIKNNDWMDDDTKNFAMEKMKGSTYKLGYPDMMKNEAKVDAVYQQVDINATDYFGNILSMNLQHRRWWNKYLREGEDRNDWVYSVYDVNLAVYWYWDEIIVPAGLLQFPVYEFDMPHYYSFGAFGTVLGHYVHHLVDSYGARWDKGGDYIKEPEFGWWSNFSNTNFKKVRQCVVDLYNNVTHGPYVLNNGQEQTIAVNGERYATEAMAITTGIRLAYNAYMTWQNQKGADTYPPGLQYTPEQMFFVAHAQRQCFNRDPTYDYSYSKRMNANEETRVNLALQELPEFSQAFSCKTGDKMFRENRCTYY